MKKERIDKILVKLGFAESIIKAQALIMAGIVLVNEKRIEKPSEIYPPEAKVRIKGFSEENKYVGRGGLKLEKALKEFHIGVSEYICLDIGASTGGFTDCLLQNGAKKIITIDVGTNQIDWRVRNDRRVEVRENVNARYLKPADFAETFDLIVMDVSFISVTKIFPALFPILKNDGKIITLVKPQFEVAKSDVDMGGVIRDKEKHERVIVKVNQFAEKSGLKVLGITESPILGAKGNKEFLVLYEKSSGE